MCRSTDLFCADAVVSHGQAEKNGQLCMGRFWGKWFTKQDTNGHNQYQPTWERRNGSQEGHWEDYAAHGVRAFLGGRLKGGVKVVATGDHLDVGQGVGKLGVQGFGGAHRVWSDGQIWTQELVHPQVRLEPPGRRGGQPLPHPAVASFPRMPRTIIHGKPFKTGGFFHHWRGCGSYLS